jgi:hypothetical protein
LLLVQSLFIELCDNNAIVNQKFVSQGQTTFLHTCSAASIQRCGENFPTYDTGECCLYSDNAPAASLRCEDFSG